MYMVYSTGFSWGMGNGAKAKVLTPTRLDIQNITQIAAGSSHCVAIDREGFVYSWGWGGSIYFT